jgi:hypothetical protein
MELVMRESEIETVLAKALVWPWGSPGPDFELVGQGQYWRFVYQKPEPRVITVHIDGAVVVAHQAGLIRDARDVVGSESISSLGSWLLTLLYEALDIYEATDLHLWFDGEDFVPKG